MYEFYVLETFLLTDANGEENSRCNKMANRPNFELFIKVCNYLGHHITNLSFVEIFISEFGVHTL